MDNSNMDYKLDWSKLKRQQRERQELDNQNQCGSCGADIGPSTSYPWHFDHEDCRAVREPLTKQQAEDEAEVSARLTGKPHVHTSACVRRIGDVHYQRVCGYLEGEPERAQ